MFWRVFTGIYLLGAIVTFFALGFAATRNGATIDEGDGRTIVGFALVWPFTWLFILFFLAGNLTAALFG